VRRFFPDDSLYLSRARDPLQRGPGFDSQQEGGFLNTIRVIYRPTFVMVVDQVNIRGESIGLTFVAV
jgi:hypothetical protein